MKEDGTLDERLPGSGYRPPGAHEGAAWLAGGSAQGHEAKVAARTNPSGQRAGASLQRSSNRRRVAPLRS